MPCPTSAQSAVGVKQQGWVKPSSRSQAKYRFWLSIPVAHMFFTQNTASFQYVWRATKQDALLSWLEPRPPTPGRTRSNEHWERGHLARKVGERAKERAECPRSQWAVSSRRNAGRKNPAGNFRGGLGMGAISKNGTPGKYSTQVWLWIDLGNSRYASYPVGCFPTKIRSKAVQSRIIVARYVN